MPTCSHHAHLGQRGGGFLERGRLFVTGRAQESICIRGANLFCYEIERVMEQVRAAGLLGT